MIPVEVKVGAILLVLATSFGSGYWVRSSSCAEAWAERDARDEANRRKAAEDARKNDQSGQKAAGEVESERLDDERKADVVYRYIDREVTRYVRENPSPAGCGLDAHGLQLWRAARDAQSVDSGEPAT